MAEGGESDFSSRMQYLMQCPICLEKLKDPKYLPCLHTFCKSCLTAHIDRMCQTGRTFRCPVCRRDVQLPASTANVSQSGDLFSTNHIIISLMDFEELKSNDKKCVPCCRGFKTATAEAWCFKCCESLCCECLNHHKTMREALLHNTILLTELKHEDILRHSVPRCEKHPDEALKYFCTDEQCRVAACQTCLSLYHRHCMTVITIEDAAEKLLESDAVSKLELEANNLLKKTKQSLADCKTSMTQCKSDFSKMEILISTTRRNINKKLNELERNLCKRVSQEKEDEIRRLQSNVDDAEGSFLFVEHLNKMLNDTEKNGSMIHSFLVYKQVADSLLKFNKNLNSHGNVPFSVYSLEINTHLEMLLCSTSFGTISKTSTKTMNMHQDKPTLIQAFPSPHGCKTQAMLLLESLILLGVDEKEKCIVIDHSGNIIHELDMPGRISQFSLFGNNRIAVVFSSVPKLLILKINSFEKSHEFSLSQNAFGVASFSTTIVVIHSASLCSLDATGRKRWTVPLDSPSDEIRHISCDMNGIIYIMSYNGDSILRFDQNGKGLSKINCPKVLQRIDGLTVDRENNVYVCGIFNSSVVQITPETKLWKRRTILDDLKSPWCIHFKSYSNIFCVSNNRGMEIRIYTMG